MVASSNLPSFQSGLDSIGNAARALRVDADSRGEEIAASALYESIEEKLEHAFKSQDLSHLLFRSDGMGAIARFIAAVPDDGRLVILNMVAAIVETHPGMNRYLRRLAATAIRALPKALPDMFRLKPDITRDKTDDDAAIANELTQNIHARMAGEFWVERGDVGQIHDKAVHAVIAADRVEGDGDLAHVMTHFGTRKQRCTTCFPDWADDLVILQLDHTGPIPAEARISALEAFNKIGDAKKRRFAVGMYRLAEQEMKEDTGAGLEERAYKLALVLPRAVYREPDQVELVIPSDPPNLTEPLKGKGERIDDETEHFISTLFMAYAAENPMSETQVALNDKWDGLWSYAPSALKPKKKGWDGVVEVVTSPMGVFTIAAMLFGLGLLALIAPPVLLFLAWAGYGLVAFLYSLVANAISGFMAMYAPNAGAVVTMTLKSLVIIYVILVLLPVVENFHPLVAAHKLRMSTLTISEQEAYKAPEPIRGSIRTARVVVTALALLAVIGGWSSGMIRGLGPSAFCAGVAMTVFAVEYANKFSPRMLQDFVRDNMQWASSWSTRIAVSLVVLGILGLAGAGVGHRFSVLTAGLADKSIEYVAYQADVKLPPTADECARKVAKLRKGAAKLGTTVVQMCDDSPDSTICRCPELDVELGR